jgi:hypothetical protein
VRRFPSAIPRAVVERLHVRYLDERGGARLAPEPVAQAWQWASRPRRVTAAVLQAADDDRVRVFDYLVDVVQRRRPPDHHVPDVVVLEILSAGSADDADGIAAVAQGRAGRTMPAWRTPGSDWALILVPQTRWAVCAAGMAR